MTTPSQPLADVSEFALPDRMRKLAARILWDLINRCRQQLANAEKRQSDAINLADQAMSSVEAKFGSVRDEQNEKLREVHSSVSSVVGELNQISAAAEAHLKSQGVDVPPITSTARSEPETSDIPPALDLAAMLGGVASEKACLQSLCQRKKPAYWPGMDAAKWAIIIVSVIMLFVFYPLVLLWPVIMLIARAAWTTSIRGDYQGLVERSQKLRFTLQTLESRISKDVEGMIRTSSDKLIPPAKEIHSEAVKAANQRLKDDVQKIGNDFRQVAEQLHMDVNQLWEDSRYAAKEWDSSEWKDWSPDPSPEFAARIGTLTISADDLQTQLARVDFNFRLPALIPFAEGRCLLFNAKGEAKDAAAEAMQSAAIRALANTPPGKARFTLIDPVGLGQNVADFMHLGDFNRDLINGKAWTEPQHIEQQLTKLTEDMETVIQTFLRKKFASIQEYNKEHHEVAEPFRFLVIFDFPVNFTESAARRLVSIVKNGPRCGVYTLILMDSSKKLPYGFSIEELRQLAVVFESEGTVSRSLSNEGEHLMGEKYYYGRGVPKDYAEAVKWWRKAAEQNYAKAQYDMGLCYANGEGVEKDYMEAVKWWRKAAEQNYADAQSYLGLCYERGEGVAKDFVEAVRWYRKAADQNVAWAQRNLGWRYANGEGVEKDYMEAVKWWRKAAEQNDAAAQYNVGWCYANGQGVAKDYVEAVKWYRKAADQSYADAQNNLGYCYVIGEGVAKDFVEAVRWYRKAAEQNDASAQRNLGCSYYKGEGVAKDFPEAYKFFKLAAEQNQTDAIEDLKQIMTGMTAVEIAEGERRYNEFISRKNSIKRKTRELENAGAIVGIGEAPTSSNSPPPQEAEIGKIYRGRVITIKEFGAFVEFLPGKDGLVHISELANFRVKQTEDIVKLGDEIWVKCLGVDEKGRVRLSRKAAMAERETNLEE